MNYEASIFDETSDRKLLQIDKIAISYTEFGWSLVEFWRSFAEFCHHYSVEVWWIFFANFGRIFIGSSAECADFTLGAWRGERWGACSYYSVRAHRHSSFDGLAVQI